MTVKELCAKHGMTQTKLSRRFNIPLRTVQGWHIGERQAPPYVVAMMDEILTNQPIVDNIKKMVDEEISKNS
jgi:DNA-binding transcriptional regulator YiaG